jgi:GT2 family glycosyltransferase
LPSSQPHTSTASPRVSVLVANWNGREVLPACLRSIPAHTRSVTFEVIVVDDASTDESVEIIKRDFPDVRLIVSPTNLGFVGANNLGVKEAAGEFIFLLNSDTELREDAIGKLVAFMDAHPEAGICGPALFNADGRPQVSYGWPPSFLQAAVDAFFLNDLFPGAGFPSRGVLPDATHTSPFPVRYVSGAALLIRSSVITQLGLFDPLFRAYCEEVDLCQRVRTRAGLECFIVPQARIMHYEGKSYGQLGAGRIRIMYESYDRFMVKYHSRAYAFCTRLLFAWHYAVKMAIRAIRWLPSTGTSRPQRSGAVRQAWYHVRYSLWPYA